MKILSNERRNIMKYGKLTQQAIDDGGYIEIDSRTLVKSDGSSRYHNVILRNGKRNHISSCSSTVSIEKAVKGIEKKLVEKESKKNGVTKPFGMLRQRVEEIRVKNFYNDKRTHNGWDLCLYPDNICVVKMHNAANTILSFDMLSDYRRVELNLYSMSFEYINDTKLKAFAELLGAIENYFESPMESREEELKTIYL